MLSISNNIVTKDGGKEAPRLEARSTERSPAAEAARKSKIQNTQQNPVFCASAFSAQSAAESESGIRELGGIGEIGGLDSGGLRSSPCVRNNPCGQMID